MDRTTGIDVVHFDLLWIILSIGHVVLTVESNRQSGPTWLPFGIQRPTTVLSQRAQVPSAAARRATWHVAAAKLAEVGVLVVTRGGYWQAALAHASVSAGLAVSVYVGRIVGYAT